MAFSSACPTLASLVFTPASMVGAEIGLRRRGGCGVCEKSKKSLSPLVTESESRSPRLGNPQFLRTNFASELNSPAR